MKCLSVRQPWADAIVHGPKRVENRSWRTDYRGPILIHAGVSRDELGALSREPLATRRLGVIPTAFGAIVGMARLVHIVSFDPWEETWPDEDQEDFAEGPECWILGDVRPIVPVPCRGSLSLFTPPADVLEALRLADTGERVVASMTRPARTALLPGLA